MIEDSGPGLCFWLVSSTAWLNIAANAVTLMLAAARRSWNAGSAITPEARAMVLMRSSAIQANCGFEVPRRSCPSSALAMRQPSLSLPTRFSAGTMTLSKNTSLNSSSPAIVLIGLM